jgi:hypothetical protein
MRFAYTVLSEVSDEATAARWVEWLTVTHLPEVVNAGASSVELLRVDALHFEARYQFESRSAFATYEAGPAIGLRAEALAAFPPSAGVKLSRTSAEVVFSLYRDVTGR